MHASCMHAHYNTTLKTHSYAMRALALSTDLDQSDMTVRTRISVKYIITVVYFFYFLYLDLAAHRLGSAGLTYDKVVASLELSYFIY